MVPSLSLGIHDPASQSHVNQYDPFALSGGSNASRQGTVEPLDLSVSSSTASGKETSRKKLTILHMHFTEFIGSPAVSSKKLAGRLETS